MKYLLSLFLFIPLVFSSRNAAAFTPKIDSVYADSIYQSYGITDVQAKGTLGKPDKQYATFAIGDLLDLAFKNSHHSDIIPIKANSTLLIWGQIDKSVDSSAGQVTFNKFDISGSLVTSKRFILGDGLNVITVPNEDWVYIELSLADPIDAGSITHAKSYLLDAIALIQDTIPPSSVLKQVALAHSIVTYPNPFTQSTTIHFELETQGDIQLVVIDGLGREVDRIQAGYLENGVHEIPFAIKTPGFYFVRLFVNGQPVGNPLKITSR
jgi:hypothetical protein